MSRIATRSFPVYTLALAAALGCTPREQQAGEQPAAPEGPNVVEIVATEYQFQMPDTLPSGPTTFRLVGQGVEPHHATVIRIDSGKTMADVETALRGSEPPTWVVPVGGPNPPPPGGGIAETTMTLQPGNYMVMCFIPAPDGMPHVAKGMMKAVTVIPSDVQRSLPTADVTIVLRDYAFETTPALTAGRHVIRVVTEAEQPHEVALVKLEAGKTAQDFIAAAEAMEKGKAPAGPPPGVFMGGVAGLARGTDNYVTVDLTPGEYALICFIGDAKDKRPHYLHGMVQQITVM
ncbi:MAG TPA: hypothetical protein VGA42_04760 [Gemmatimonadales bacterium]